jgi:hypothetical protein
VTREKLKIHFSKKKIDFFGEPGLVFTFYNLWKIMYIGANVPSARMEALTRITVNIFTLDCSCSCTANLL